MMSPVYLSLGSNLGVRLQALRRALAELPAAGVEPVRVSSVYETEPVGLLEQPWFLNCVAEGRTAAGAEELMTRLLALEARLGRRRRGVPPRGPRTIDVDIIFYGELVLNTPQLTVPHPRYRQRRFVLRGLTELAPGLRDPETGENMRDLLAQVEDSSEVRRLEVDGWPALGGWRAPR